MYESAASLSVSKRITTTGLVFDPHPVDLPDFTGASEPRALLQVRSVRTFRPLQALVAVLACMCAANQVAPPARPRARILTRRASLDRPSSKPNPRGIQGRRGRPFRAPTAREMDTARRHATSTLRAHGRATLQPSLGRAANVRFTAAPRTAPRRSTRSPAPRRPSCDGSIRSTAARQSATAG